MATVFHNDFSNGDIIEWELAADAVSGVPIALGASSRVGIPLTDGLSGETIAVKLNGVVKLPKAATAFVAGTTVDWDDGGGQLVASGGAGDILGFIPIQAAASGDAEALVIIPTAAG